MSIEQTAYLNRRAVPTYQALQTSIDSLGFDCKLDASYTPFQSSGFLPCLLEGRSSGFEIYFESAASQLQNFPHLEQHVGEREAAVTFRWGGSMHECACALIVSAALAKDFGAVVHYHDDDILYSVEQLQAEASAALKHARRSKR